MTDELAPGAKFRDIGFSLERRVRSSFKRARVGGAHVDRHREKVFMADGGDEDYARYGLTAGRLINVEQSCVEFLVHSYL